MSDPVDRGSSVVSCSEYLFGRLSVDFVVMHLICGLWDDPMCVSV